MESTTRGIPSQCSRCKRNYDGSCPVTGFVNEFCRSFRLRYPGKVDVIHQGMTEEEMDIALGYTWLGVGDTSVVDGGGTHSSSEAEAPGSSKELTVLPPPVPLCTTPAVPEHIPYRAEPVSADEVQAAPGSPGVTTREVKDSQRQPRGFASKEKRGWDKKRGGGGKRGGRQIGKKWKR